MDKQIGFIGTGYMARALARGFRKNQEQNQRAFFGYDINPKALQEFVDQTGGIKKDSIKELVESCDVVFLAVKPQQVGGVLSSIAQLRDARANTLWFTVAAGIPIQRYLKEMGHTAKLVRVMPNGPCRVGEGVCGFSVSEEVKQEDLQLASDLLSTVGIAIQFPERQLDAVAGLSGSGPAFVYLMIEAMADGGVKMGLSRQDSIQLAAQTVLGAATVVLQTEEHPAVLKDSVCSPRGTTIAAIHQLEKSGLRAAMISAVEMATLRSKELATETI